VEPLVTVYDDWFQETKHVGDGADNSVCEGVPVVSVMASALGTGTTDISATVSITVATIVPNLTFVLPNIVVYLLVDFGNPAAPAFQLWSPGFAPPPFSGFAFIDSFLSSYHLLFSYQISLVTCLFCGGVSSPLKTPPSSCSKAEAAYRYHFLLTIRCASR